MDITKQVSNNEHLKEEVFLPSIKDLTLQELKSELAENSGDIEKQSQILYEIEQKLDKRVKILGSKEHEMALKAEKLEERERILAGKERILEQDALDIAQKSDQIEKGFARIKKEAQKNSKTSSNLYERERALDQKEANMRTEIFEGLREEISEYHKRELSKIDEEIAHNRKNRMEGIAEEAEMRRQELDQDIAKSRAEALKKIDAEKKSLLDEVAIALEKNRQEAKRIKEEADAIENRRRELERKEQDFAIAQNRVAYKEQQLDERMANWEGELESRLNGRNHEYDAKINAQEEAIVNLRLALEANAKQMEAFESATIVYGDLPVMQKKIDDLQNANEKLRAELSKAPSAEIAADCERFKARAKELELSVESMRDDIDRARAVSDENEDLQRKAALKDKKIEDLEWAWNESQAQIRALEERIDRLTASKTTPADRENRADSIRQPYLLNPFKAQAASNDAAKKDGETKKNGETKKDGELDWLNKIGDLCDKYHVSFPKRILYAFHTSLKIANWSTITVLAGVSGTGKSELPRLYSAFGGINFINVPVQPNWDSQESMLGFFNSIDNKFDAQPMLRFLYQCTGDLAENMAIVLLDEMNLAHVEHYFADFLSKLESRRSYAKKVPTIDVSLGAGVAPYELPLSRNILYCGTMNQDETTKSLSDKVLDRGIVINFPRPRHLIDRDSACNITKFVKDKDIKPLSQRIWNSWVEKKVIFEGSQREELNRYRGILEGINDHLAEVGRAIGHRVWQSVEHYVMNYPDVRNAFYNVEKGELTDELKQAMHIAVEDQLVQKVMPKLRGIETSGTSRDKCLDPIRTLLLDNDFNLDNDYERACEMGYGQFMWCSAEYIGDGEEK